MPEGFPRNGLPARLGDGGCLQLPHAPRGPGTSGCGAGPAGGGGAAGAGTAAGQGESGRAGAAGPAARS